ncbi:MAG TPA: hemerythrin [Clostridiales bacterium]|nr:hemerythrin [Clostridiales bacterium]
MGRATQDLRKEHEAILFVLQIFDKMLQSGERDLETMLHYYGEVLYFLKIFADKCHHGKEENYLFEELVNKGIPNEGGPVGVMLREHAEGRDYIAQMSSSLDDKDLSGFNEAAVNYRDLLRSHIDKENNVLFVMADRVLGEEEQNLLFEKFEQHEENVIGQGVHDKLHSMIDIWAEAFGVE